MTLDQRVSIRDVHFSDTSMILNYWYRSPEGFIEERGVDLKKLPAEETMKLSLEERIQKNSQLEKSKLNAFVILFENLPIGFHTLSPVEEGKFGIFHAHICLPEFRKRGVGMSSYPIACKEFIQRFNLEKIVFKTPKQNTGALRVKEKLGIKKTGEEKIGFGIIKDGTDASVFEWTRFEIQEFFKETSNFRHSVSLQN
jgi:RimJ/RimL family protein N-acetyltransferase